MDYPITPVVKYVQRDSGYSIKPFGFWFRLQTILYYYIFICFHMPHQPTTAQTIDTTHSRKGFGHVVPCRTGVYAEAAVLRMAWRGDYNAP